MSIDIEWLEKIKSEKRSLRARIDTISKTSKVRPFTHQDILSLEDSILNAYDSYADISDSLQLLALQVYDAKKDSEKDEVYKIATEIAERVLDCSEFSNSKSIYNSAYLELVTWCSFDILDSVLELQESGFYEQPKYASYAIERYEYRLTLKNKQQTDSVSTMRKNQSSPSYTHQSKTTVAHNQSENTVGYSSKPIDESPSENGDKPREHSTGKRILSWLVLIGCYCLFAVVVVLDLLLLSYLSKLYFDLSSFLKILIIIFGGTAIIGLFTAPLYYGIPLTFSASEAVCTSRKGDRYIVLGTLIIVSCLINAILNFRIHYVLIGIYGIALFVYGRTHAVELSD